MQVADIEEKLDMLIKAYMQDRERLLALPLVPENSSHSTNLKNNPPAPPPPPAPGASILTSSTSVVSDDETQTVHTKLHTHFHKIKVNLNT